MNSACMMCRYNDHPSEYNNLERLARFLEQIVKNTDVRNIHHYVWHSNNKCTYGITCSKITNYNHKFNNITNQLNQLLTAYIETTDCEDNHQILQYLQGYFPNVYRDFEISVRQKMSKKED